MDSCRPQEKAWLGAHGRTRHWDEDEGGEGGVVGGDVAAVDDGGQAAVAAVGAPGADDHGVEGSGWKGDRW